MNPRAFVAPVVLLLGCKAALGQDDGFAERVRGGCKSLDECEQLEAEARSRVAGCKSNTIGYVPCSDARADLVLARSYVKKQEKTAKEKSDQERQRAADDRKAVHDMVEQQHDAEAAAAAHEREERVADDLRRRAWERREAEQKAEADAATARAKRLEYLRLMPAAERMARLRDCHAAGGGCDEVVADLLESASGEPEKRQLVAANEQWKKSPPPAPRSGGVSGGGGRAQCCDGTLSPSCGCGGGSGCCSRHGGVCGCN